MSRQLNFCSHTANDIDTLFDKYLKCIDRNVDQTKKTIAQQFDNIIQQLQQRQKQLNEQLGVWKVNRIEHVKQEKSNIVEYNNMVQAAMKQCNELIQNKDNSIENSAKIKNICGNILDNKKYKKYQQTNKISNYLETVITNSDITFQDEIECKNINSFGNIKESFAKDIMFKPPIIVLSPAIKQGESANGYKVRLEWNVISQNSQTNKSNDDFIIKYQTITAGFDDDEKKLDHTDIYWQILKYDKIECLEGNSFAVNIMNKTFALNRKYEFKIECLIETPIHLKITSNIEKIIVDTDDRPKGNIEKIELECTRHRSDNNGPPSNMLCNDDSYYWSAFYSDFKKDENDWLQLEMKLNKDEIDKDIAYFPLRFVILNHSGYQKQGVKHMSIKIGNSKNDEWYEYNEGMDPITVQKTDESQSFDISGVNSKIVKNKRLTCIRLEFSTNWGFTNDFGSKYAVKEFQVYGIKF